MFDIGFWELTVIAIIALVVIGPDRLPGFARAAGLWIGKARRFFYSVKNDIDRELQVEEMKRIIKPREFEEIHEIMEETQTAVADAGAHLSKIDSPTSPSTAASPPPTNPVGPSTDNSGKSNVEP